MVSMFASPYRFKIHEWKIDEKTTTTTTIKHKSIQITQNTTINRKCKLRMTEISYLIKSFIFKY